MVHIKDDKRSRTSAERLYQALSSCLKEKSFDRITIAELQRVSAVGRATFYRNFDCLIDVLFWRCDLAFGEMAEGFLAAPAYQGQPEGLLQWFFEFWTRHSAILEQLLAINRLDIIQACHLKNSHGITAFFRTREAIPVGNYDYFMALRSGVLIGMLSVWLARGRTETPAQLLGILAEQIEFIRSSRAYL